MVDKGPDIQILIWQTNQRILCRETAKISFLVDNGEMGIVKSSQSVMNPSTLRGRKCICFEAKMVKYYDFLKSNAHMAWRTTNFTVLKFKVCSPKCIMLILKQVFFKTGINCQHLGYDYVDHPSGQNIVETHSP